MGLKIAKGNFFVPKNIPKSEKYLINIYTIN